MGTRSAGDHQEITNHREVLRLPDVGYADYASRMGMFDEVTCEYALPDAFDARGVLFQTKELDNALPTDACSGSAVDPYLGTDRN